MNHLSLVRIFADFKKYNSHNLNRIHQAQIASKRY